MLSLFIFTSKSFFKKDELAFLILISFFKEFGTWELPKINFLFSLMIPAFSFAIFSIPFPKISS